MKQTCSKPLKSRPSTCCKQPAYHELRLYKCFATMWVSVKMRLSSLYKRFSVRQRNDFYSTLVVSFRSTSSKSIHLSTERQHPALPERPQSERETCLTWKSVQARHLYKISNNSYISSKFLLPSFLVGHQGPMFLYTTTKTRASHGHPKSSALPKVEAWPSATCCTSQSGSASFGLSTTKIFFLWKAIDRQSKEPFWSPKLEGKPAYLPKFLKKQSSMGKGLGHLPLGFTRFHTLLSTPTQRLTRHWAATEGA